MIPDAFEFSWGRYPRLTVCCSQPTLPYDIGHFFQGQFTDSWINHCHARESCARLTVRFECLRLELDSLNAAIQRLEQDEAALDEEWRALLNGSGLP